MSSSVTRAASPCLLESWAPVLPGLVVPSAGGPAAGALHWFGCPLPSRWVMGASALLPLCPGQLLFLGLVWEGCVARSSFHPSLPCGLHIRPASSGWS